MRRKIPPIFMIKDATFASWCFILMISLIWQYTNSAFAQTKPQVSPATAPKRIVLLYSYGDGIPAYQQATRGFLSVMKEGRVSVNNLFFEYLDLEREKDEEHKKNLVTLFRHKYEGKKVDLVVTVHTQALKFILSEGKNLFSAAPVLSFLAPDMIETPGIERRVLLLPMKMDFRGTLELALKLFPQTQRVVFVNGVGEGEKRLEVEAKSVFAQWPDRLEFEYTDNLSVEEMLQRIANLPSRTIVFYSNVFRDKTSRTFVPRDVAEMVARAANAPVFGMYNTILGSGIIGGSVFNFEAEGARAAAVALDVLKGNLSLTKLVTILAASRIPMFDWLQLKRWGLSESALPPDSIVLNKPAPVWQGHTLEIIGILAFCLLETVLIIFLIVQKRRKGVAEKALDRKTKELDEFFKVSLDLLCIANTDGYFLHLNPAWETTLGFTRGELMAKRFLERVHPDDLERTQEAISTLASQQKVTFFENRYRCKDGTYRWLEWSASPAGPLIYCGARDITERKYSEEALRTSEQRFKTAFTTGADAYVIVTRDDGTIREVNDRFLDLYGYSRDEVIGRTSLELGMWAIPEARNRLLEEIFLHDHVENFEVLARRKGGETFWVLYSVSQLKIAGPPLIFGAIRDITDRKMSEKVLEERLQFEQLLSDLSARFVNIPLDRVDSEIERGLREILEFFRVERCGLIRVWPEKAAWVLTHVALAYNIPSPPVGVELSLSIVPWVNEKLIHKREIVSLSRLDNLPPEAWRDKQTWIEWGVQSGMYIPIMAGQSDPYVFAIDSMTRECIWPEEISQRLRLLGEILVNVLERKHVEEALQDSEQRFRQVAESVGDFIWEVDANGLYRYTSPSVERILGYRSDELIGKKHFYDLFAPEVREELKTAAFKVFAAKEAFRVFPNPNITKKGNVVHLETSGVPVLNVNGNLLGYRGADTDVTERKRAEAALRESERELRQNEGDLRKLAGRLISAHEEERSHLARELHDDLAQRLAVFAIEVGKLENQLMDQPAPVLEALLEMKKDMVKIAQDVHGLSRQLHPSILDDLGLIKAVESECTNVSRREGIDIVFNHENIPTVIPKDMSLSLYRIIQEGLSNISKHACADHISVSLKGIDHNVYLSVQDDGIGFDSAEVKKKPGLGLSSIRERVRLIHGELSIQSQPEKGTLISVRVPLTKEEE